MSIFPARIDFDGWNREEAWATSYKGEALFAGGIIWSNSILGQGGIFLGFAFVDERTADGNH